MTYRIAINGFGRIGRSYLRRLLAEDLAGTGLQVIAVNDLRDPATLAELLASDATDAEAGLDGDLLVAGWQSFPAFAERSPDALPWGELRVDLVLEATGRVRTRDDAALHLKAGAGRVLIAAPARDADATLVPGVNAGTYDPVRHRIVAAASGPITCVTPLLKVINDAFGIEYGHLTTLHAGTDDPRAGAGDIVPAGTGVARTIGLVLPELDDRISGVALRVPAVDGSVSELTLQLRSRFTAREVDAAVAAAAADPPMRGIIRYAAAPLVSGDVVGDPAACVYDPALTQVAGHMVKVFGWYDDDWGYVNRLADLTRQLAGR